MTPTRSLFTVATNITGFGSRLPASGQKSGACCLKPMMSAFSFEITHTHAAARRGVMQTPHGAVHTPAFMPVGTQGAVKGMTHRDLEGLGAEIMLGNTYHLYLRPGAERIGRLGGLHAFIGWNRAILTDSGGYQVFSLAARRNVHEEGVTFRSHLDG